MEQTAPLTVNFSGLVFEPPQVPLKPMLTEPPGGTDPFHGKEVAVTSLPLCCQLALQPWLTVCPDGKVKRSSQESHGVLPVLVSVTEAVKPPGQSLVWYVTAQEALGVGVSSSFSVVKVTVAGVERLPAAS